MLVVAVVPTMGGVCVPGVAGGVNAGERRDGGGSRACDTSPWSAAECFGGGIVSSSIW